MTRLNRLPPFAPCHESRIAAGIGATIAGALIGGSITFVGVRLYVELLARVRTHGLWGTGGAGSYTLLPGRT